jgi:hypothetical protein
MNETKNWFVHVEWVVVLVTLLGGFYLLDGKIERQGQRTDNLYAMYCDTQKEIANISRENGDRFYTLLQEIHKNKE